MGRLAESVMARKKKVDFYSASPDVQPPSSIIPSLRYFRLCRIAQPPAVQVAAVCLPTLVTTNSPYSSSYPDSCFLGPVGTAQKITNVSLYTDASLNPPEPPRDPRENLPGYVTGIFGAFSSPAHSLILSVIGIEMGPMAPTMIDQKYAGRSRADHCK